ncbi:hypothetical protein R84981_001704 [Carnimonas sp. R-84981]|uniref:phage tail tape measure protein n=1 Tax=Carnimonas bestiolae TaxID=3402172 RepID=UPI003EDC91E1
MAGGGGDLNVALRIRSEGGQQSRRDVQQLNQELRRVGREGAQGLNREMVRTGASMSKVYKDGKIGSQGLRDAVQRSASDGSAAWKRASGEIGRDLNNVRRETTRLGTDVERGNRRVGESYRQTDRTGIEPMRRSIERTGRSTREMVQNSTRQLDRLKTTASGVREEFGRMRGMLASGAAVAGIGIGAFAFSQNVSASAERDRQLIRAQQMGGMSDGERDLYRKTGYLAAQRYGIGQDSLFTAGSELITKGQSGKAARNSLDALGRASAITGYEPSALAIPLSAGARAWNVNLEDEGAADNILSQVITGSRRGGISAEAFGDIVRDSANRAQQSGFSMPEYFSVISNIARTEQDPQRASSQVETLVDSFNQSDLRQQIQDVSGVRVDNADKTPRDVGSVLSELSKVYNNLKNSADQQQFLAKLSNGGGDELPLAFRAILPRDGYQQYASSVTSLNNDPAGSLQGDVDQNVNSASAAKARARARFSETIDRMSQPINEAVSGVSGYLLDNLNLSGGQMIAGGALAAAGLYGAGHAAGGIGRRMASGGSTLSNIAVGRALEETTGVQPVFVTNWPSGGMPSGGVLPGEGGGGNGKGRGGWIRSLGRFGRVALPLSVLQGGVDTYRVMSDDQMSSQQKDQALRHVGGRAAGGAVGATVGGAVGGAVGSVVPFAGTAVGGVLGTVLGGWGGSTIGDFASSWFDKSGSAESSDKSADPKQVQAALDRLEKVLGQPLVIDVRADQHWIYADAERRDGLLVRRGG